MDFLVTGGHPLITASAALAASSVAVVNGPELAHISLGDNHLYASRLLAPASMSRQLIFDGSLSVGGRLHHPLLRHDGETGLTNDVDAILAARQDELDGSGVYCLGWLTAACLNLATDPLSQYPLFYCSDDAGWMVSNCIPMLVTARRALGMGTTRSLLPCIANLLIGSPVADESHFDEIRRLPFGMALHAGRSLHFTHGRLDRYDANDYDEALGLAQRSIRRHVDAVTTTVAAPRSIVTDITGGTDSRCVLSFLLKSSLADEMTGRCIARRPHPDAEVATSIMAQYGIDIAAFPVFRYIPGGFGDELAVRENAALFGGARDPAAPVALVALQNLVHFKGMFGEIAGATPGSVHLENYLASAGWTVPGLVDLWIERRQRVRASELLSAEAKSRVRQALIVAFDELISQGVRPPHLLSEFYLRSRSRSHFGSYSWIENHSRVLPEILANPWLVVARRLTPAHLVRYGKPIFDLTLANDSRLTFMPLAGSGWPTELIPSGMRQEPFAIAADDQQGPGRALFRALAVDGPARVFTPVTHGGSSRSTPRSATSGSVPAYQHMLEWLLDAADSTHEMWRWFDRSVVEGYVARPVESFDGADGGAMGRMAAGAMHMLALEITPRVAKIDQLVRPD